MEDKDKKDTLSTEERIQKSLKALEILWGFYLEDKLGKSLKDDPTKREIVLGLARFGVVSDVSSVSEALDYCAKQGWRDQERKMRDLGFDARGQNYLRLKAGSLRGYVNGSNRIPWKKCKEELDRRGLLGLPRWAEGINLENTGRDTLGKVGGTDPGRFEGSKGGLGVHPADEE